MDTVERSSSVILVVADSNFINLCDDPAKYISKLRDVMASRPFTPGTLFTVSGRYGLSNIDPTIPVIDIDDKNKTVFGQTLENSFMMFDELLSVSVAGNDPFLCMAREVATSNSKSFTQYGYPARKGK